MTLEVVMNCPGCGHEMEPREKTIKPTLYAAWCEWCDWEEEYDTWGEAENAFDDHIQDSHSHQMAVFEKERDPSDDDGRRVGEQYMFCRECKREEDIPIAAQLRAAGHTALPGFE